MPQPDEVYVRAVVHKGSAKPCSRYQNSCRVRGFYAFTFLTNVNSVQVIFCRCSFDLA